VNISTLNSCEVPHGLKKLELDFSQALRLLQESQFLLLNTWLVSLSILYNTISAIVLDPEKNLVKVFFRPWDTWQESRVLIFTLLNSTAHHGLTIPR
jgi:hypothetical protein